MRRPTVDLLLADTPAKANMQSKARVNGTRGAHIGAAEKIRDCLRCLGALRKIDLIAHTGLPHETVSTALREMLGHTGGIVSGGKRGDTRYALFDSPEGRAMLRQPEEEVSTEIAEGAYAIAVPPCGFEWMELKRDPFDHWKLAMTLRGST